MTTMPTTPADDQQWQDERHWPCPIIKARANPGSLRLAINAKCCECMGGSNEPGWRREVRECSSRTCPLYPVRPFRQSAADDD